jgi:WD40 repeat protein
MGTSINVRRRGLAWAVAFLAAFVLGASAQTPPAMVVIKGSGGPVVFLRFSPKGGELARISQFGPVALFGTSDYHKARTFAIGMRMVAYSADGTRIATAEGTDGARIWDASAPGTALPHSVQTMSLSADDVFMLDTPLQVLQTPSRDSTQRIFWSEFSPDGKRLITTHANGHVKIWNTDSWVVDEEPVVTDGEVHAAAFSPDGKTVMIGDTNGALHLWSLADQKEIKTVRTPAGVTGITFSPDGQMLVTTHQSASTMIWNTQTWIAQVENGYSSAAYSPDGKTLALGGSHIRLIDSISRKQIREIELPTMTMTEISEQFRNMPNANTKVGILIGALAFAPNGFVLAAGCMDGTVRVLNLKLTR